MTDAPTGAVWRKRMQDFARHAGRPHAPLFAPLAFAVAAQIEAIDVGRMTLEGTRLRRNVLELQRVLRTDAVFCAAPSAMEIEALGASVDCGSWPPRPVGSIPDSPGETGIDPRKLAASPRVAASLDAARQLASEASEPVIVAAFTGPATLVGELRSAGSALDEDEIWDFAGRLLAAFGRLYAEAGVNVLQWHERSLPDPSSEDLWKAALGTIGNVARFHRVPPLLVVEATSSLAWPVQVLPCPTWQQHPAPVARAHARGWAPDPAAWPVLPAEGSGERSITTTSEIEPTLAIADLKRHVDRVRPS